MSIVPALREGIHDTEKMGDRTYAILEEIGKEYGEPVFYYILGKEAKAFKTSVTLPADMEPRDGYIMPEFEKLKKDPALQEKFIDAFIRAHGLTNAYRSRIKEYLQLAMDAAEEIARYIGKDGKYVIPAEQFERFEKFNKFLDTIMETEFGVRPARYKQEKRKQRRIVRPEELLARTIPEPEKPRQSVQKPKGKAKTQRASIPSEVLAIAKALEYSGFSSDALKRAEEDLLRRLDVLLENPEGNALEIAYTVKLLRLVQRGEIDKIREFSK